MTIGWMTKIRLYLWQCSALWHVDKVPFTIYNFILYKTKAFSQIWERL